MAKLCRFTVTVAERLAVLGAELIEALLVLGASKVVVLVEEVFEFQRFVGRQTVQHDPVLSVGRITKEVARLVQKIHVIPPQMTQTIAAIHAAIATPATPKKAIATTVSPN
jgi:hypothetical protein